MEEYKDTLHIRVWGVCIISGSPNERNFDISPLGLIHLHPFNLQWYCSVACNNFHDLMYFSFPTMELDDRYLLRFVSLPKMYQDIRTQNHYIELR